MPINRNDYNFDTDDDDIFFLDDESYDSKYDYDDYDDDDDEDTYIDFEYDEEYDNNNTYYANGEQYFYDQETKSYKTRKQFLVSELISYAKIFVVAFIIAILFTKFIIINAVVPSGSMKNTIQVGDRLIGLRLAYIFSEPQRGDIIIFKFPDDETQNYVKRVIGIPGDVIQIIEGELYVNGELQHESYIAEDMSYNSTEQVYIVPEDSYFVLGDNRNYSDDSRLWKTTNYVPRENILAKVLFRYFNVETKKLDFTIID